MDLKKTMATALIMIEQGGIQPGGLNFDAKVRKRKEERTTPAGVAVEHCPPFIVFFMFEAHTHLALRHPVPSISTYS